MAKGRELIRGLSGNNLKATCKIRVIEDDPESGDPLPAKLKAIVEGECIVASKTVPEQEAYLRKAAGLIQNTGGKASHGNVFANNKQDEIINPTTGAKTYRPTPIPSIYNTQGVVQADGSTTQLATDVLKDGQIVVVEAFTETVEQLQADGTLKRRSYGAVFEYIPEAPPVKKPTLAQLMEKYRIKQE